MRNPGRWARARNIYVNDPRAVPCVHCDIPIIQDQTDGRWFHDNVPSAFWTLCPNDPEEALEGLHEAGHASTRPEPGPLFSREEMIVGLQEIEADLR